MNLQVPRNAENFWNSRGNSQFVKRVCAPWSWLNILKCCFCLIRCESITSVIFEVFLLATVSSKVAANSGMKVPFEEVEMAVCEWLRMQEPEYSRNGMFKLVLKRGKCPSAPGANIETLVVV